MAPNRLSASVADRHRQGMSVLDLTVSNPTIVGLSYPEALTAAPDDPRVLEYNPHPFGMPAARTAVAAEYRRHGLDLAPERVVLSASTSEAYTWLFKLLCDPGDRVLVPAPSYPLFAHLARLDSVELDTYWLDYHGVWSIDLASLDSGLTPRTRALVVVSPNNPTGSYLRRHQWETVLETCAARDVAVICDEVFIDYPVDPAEDAVLGPCFAREPERGPLMFSLGGLSKSVGLPQFKLGWLILHGPLSLVTAANERLELICDSYLSVGTPVQVAAPRLFADGAQVRAAIADRIRRNWRALGDRVSRSPSCGLLRVEGGWSAVIRVPSTQPEETLALQLVEEDGVLVHPGFFFDFRTESYLVVSLLPAPESFDRGVDLLCRRAEVADAAGRGASCA
jgi:aspartate/methionine/tyrosine aminotransferase